MNVDNFIDKKKYLEFINNLDEDQIDSVGDDYTSCWLYALYIHTLLDLPIDDCECVYNNHLLNIHDIIQLFEQNGIYSFYHTNKTEFHHFICYINNDELYLFSTYGKQKGIIYKTFNKIDWITQYLNLFSNGNENQNKINEYKSLFGITKKIENLDLSQCIFMYTFKQTMLV